MWKAHETIPKRNYQLEVCLDGGRKLERTSVKLRFLLLGGGSCPTAMLGNFECRARDDAPLGGNGRDTEAATNRRTPSWPPGPAAYSGGADCGAAVMRSGICTPWSALTCTRAPIMAGGPFAVTSRKTSAGAGDCRWSVAQARLRKSWDPNYKLSRIELKIYNFGEECEFTRTSQQWSAAAVSTVPVRIPWGGGFCVWSLHVLPGTMASSPRTCLSGLAESANSDCRELFVFPCWPYGSWTEGPEDRWYHHVILSRQNHHFASALKRLNAPYISVKSH